MDQRCALHDQSVTRSLQSLQILLFDALQRHEPHGWPVGSFENGFGINRIILRSLHEWLDETRMDQANGITQRLEDARSEEHTSELQSLMRISYAVFYL